MEVIIKENKVFKLISIDCKYKGTSYNIVRKQDNRTRDYRDTLQAAIDSWDLCYSENSGYD
jgi:hypothetical protein